MAGFAYNLLCYLGLSLKIFLQQALRGKIMADIVIVGGGIYGCTVAWNLAKQGMDVHLLEAKTIASGASGGLGERGVRANGRDVRELPFMRMAYDMWTTLHEEIGGETGYRRLGHLLLIEREQDLTSANAQVWMQNQQGIPTQLLSAEELREMEPHVSENVIAAIYCPNDGVADHTQTTRSMAQAAQKHGAVIQENAKVTGMEKDGEIVTAIIATIDGEETHIPVGKQVILVSNYHVLPFVEEHLNIHLPLWRMLPQVMALQPMDKMPMTHLIGHAHRTLAIKPLLDNRVMISGGWHGQWNEKTGQGEPIAEQVEGNRQEAIAVYPSLKEVPVDEAFTDRVELISIDHIPIIDTLPGADNMLVGVGWSGHGWAISPAVSKLMADWVITGKRPKRLTPFSYQRFTT